MCSERSTRWTSRRAALLRAAVPALLLSILTPTQARPALDAVAVRATESVLLDVESGGTATMSFLVSNRSDRRVELLETVEFPPGWKLVMGGSSFALAPGEERLRLAVFRAPFTAAAGSYMLVYEVTDSGGGSAYGRDEVRVAVPVRGGVDIVASDVSARVIAGRNITAGLSVVNVSNVQRTVSLRLTSSEGFPVVPEAASFVMEAGGRREVAVSVGTPEDLAAPVDHVLRAEVTAEAPGAELESATTSVVQEVLPRVSGTNDRYNRVPAVIRLAHVGSSDGSGFQVEFSGRGGLDDEGSGTIDFLFRGPGTKDDSIFGLREQYGLGLSGESYDVRLGDGVYEFSRLTGHRRRGRGASVAADAGPMSLEAVYYRTRSWQPEADRTAARVEYRASETFQVGLNCVRTWRHDGDIVSLDAGGEPLPGLDVDFEYAGQALAGRRHAYWVRARGAHGTSRYVLERIRAREGFTGQYSNEVHTTGSLSVSILKAGRLTALMRNYENGGEALPLVSQDGDPILSSTTRELTRSLGLKTALSSVLRASAGYKFVSRTGRSSTSSFDYETRTASVGVEHAGPKLSAVTSFEFGRLEDLTAGSGGDVRRYSATLGLKPGPGWRLSGHFTSVLSGSPDPANRSDVLGLDVEVSPLDAVTLSAGAQWRGLVAGDTDGPDHLTASVDWTLPLGHRVTCEVRRTRLEGMEPESAVRLYYEIPMRTPVTRRRDTGVLRGRVVDSEHPKRSGLADVLLTVGGATAVTDENGDYVFPALEPGEHQLSIDPSTIGFDRVATVPLPRTLAIEGGEESRLDLSVVRSASIEGEVVAACPPLDDRESGVRGEVGNVPPLVVELTNGRCELRRMTDAAGRFCFDHVCPGRWVLTIDSGGVPRFMELRRDVFVLIVRPGSTTNVRATVDSSTESIPIIDEGIVSTASLDP